jgi:putative addiction module component (TIGR02574 family)
MEEIKKEILHLSAQDRASLAKIILLSLDQEENDEDEYEIEAAWIEEVQKRAKEFEKNPTIGKNAEEVFKDLRSKYK